MRAAERRARKRGAIRAGTALLVALAAAWMPPPAWAEEAWDGERAFAEMERLQAEIGLLRGLAGAQAALEAWNRVRAEAGAGPAALAAGLCAGPALAPWCRALPATFGADIADGRQGEDGER